jgi:hypothetical protein
MGADSAEPVLGGRSLGWSAFPVAGGAEEPAGGFMIALISRRTALDNRAPTHLFAR